MIIDYDHNQNLTTDQKLQSLAENIQLALNEIKAYLEERVTKKEIDEIPKVIEQGTKGIWTYRKWSDGTAECFGSYTNSIAVTTSSAAYGGYRSGEISIPTFPITFKSAPVVNANVASSGGVWLNNVNNITTTGGKFYLSSGVSSATASRTIAFHVSGKWK